MNDIIQFRASVDVCNAIRASAEKSGLSVSEYCRDIILRNGDAVIIEGLTEILNAIYKLVDANIDSEAINHLTAIVSDGLERILDKLDSLNA